MAPTPHTVDIECSSCGAALTLEPHLRTATCPYCDSPTVVERPSTPDRPTPTFVVGFQLEQKTAETRLRQWIRGKWLAHRGMRTATVGRTRGIYVPGYLYAAVARSGYQAAIGEDYTTTETYTTTDAKGNTTTHTRTVTHTEWRSLSGEHARYILDVLVTASRGVENAELQAIEPFDLRRLARYDPAVISGWMAEEPSLSHEHCRDQAHQEAVQEIAATLGEFMPGDSYRDLRFETRLHDEVIDLVLLPVWVFALRYHPERPPARLLVNGQTGKVAGQVPRDPWKITGVVLAAVAVVVALALLFSGGA